MASSPTASSCAPHAEGTPAEGTYSKLLLTVSALSAQLAARSPMMVRGGGVPRLPMASMPLLRMGPPLRSSLPMRITASWFGSLHPPHTRMWHESSCTTRGLLLGHRHPDHSKCAVVLGAVKAQALRVGRRQAAPALTVPARAGDAGCGGSGRRNGCQDRGRDGDCSPPPAQIRTCPIKAYGSYLECLTAKRALGQG